MIRSFEIEAGRSKVKEQVDSLFAKSHFLLHYLGLLTAASKDGKG